MADHSEMQQLTDLMLLVPAGASLVGATSSRTTQNLLIEGSYAGAIELGGESRLVIAEGAEVQGERIAAHHVTIHGNFDGHISAMVVDIGEKAKVVGSIRYGIAFGSKPGARLRASIQGPETDE